MKSGPIVHVVQHLRPGGLEVMALELARAQAAHMPTYVLSLEGDKEATIAAWPRLEADRNRLLFAGKRPGLDPLLTPSLVRLFRRLRPSCVHTHHVGPLLYAGPAARLAGARRIHTEHDAWHLADRRRRRVVRAALRLARPRVVADAPHVAIAMQNALQCAIPTVILNGIDTDGFVPAHRDAARALLGLPADIPVIGIAARLESVKGVDVALDALARVETPCLLVIAGQGSERATLEARAQALGLGARVRFLGLVDGMAGFYAALDVFCLPSRAEGLPLSLLEAQSCGVRVVASDVGGVAAAVCPASSRLVPAEDPEALAQALRLALADVQRAPGPVAAARDFVVATASLDQAANAYLALAREKGDAP